MSTVLVIEGVTGAGKTAVIELLRARWAASGVDLDFVPEDETLGTLMDQVRDPDWQRAPTYDALVAALARVEHGVASGRRVLVERFHLTAHALFPAWDRLARLDARLAELGARHVLLAFPDALVAERSIDRPERDGWAAGMAAWYGSRDQAIATASESQRRRIDALTRSALPFLHLDTRERDWPRYADVVQAFAGWS